MARTIPCPSIRKGEAQMELLKCVYIQKCTQQKGNCMSYVWFKDGSSIHQHRPCRWIPRFWLRHRVQAQYRMYGWMYIKDIDWHQRFDGQETETRHASNP